MMMTRTSRTPTFIVVGLVVVILIVGYNYWQSMTVNNDLRQQLISLEENLADLKNKKSSVDKQNEIFENRVKFFEQRSETNQQAMNKKDEEMSELSKKLKDANGEVEKLKASNDESGNKLKACDEDKVTLEKMKAEKLSLAEEITKLNSQITELTAKEKLGSDCETQVKSKLTEVFTELYKEYTDAKLRDKFKQVFKVDEKLVEALNAKNDTTTAVTEEKKDVKRDADVVEKKTEGICSLPMSAGKCNAVVAKFYFDSTAKECKPFNYTGCDGNDNNFDTKDMCENECVQQQQLKSTVATAAAATEAVKKEENAANNQLNEAPVVTLAKPPPGEEAAHVHDDHAALAKPDTDHNNNSQGAPIDEQKEDDAAAEDSVKQPAEPKM